jgi:hypothetical protein
VELNFMPHRKTYSGSVSHLNPCNTPASQSDGGLGHGGASNNQLHRVQQQRQIRSLRSRDCFGATLLRSALRGALGPQSGKEESDHVWPLASIILFAEVAVVADARR